MKTRKILAALSAAAMCLMTGTQFDGVFAQTYGEFDGIWSEVMGYGNIEYVKFDKDYKGDFPDYKIIYDYVKIIDYVGEPNDRSEITEIVIPARIDGLPVRIIGEDACCELSNATSVIIPNSVTNIETCAFYNCDGLKSIEIPDSVLALGFGVFDDCNNLTDIIMSENIIDIADYAFRDCYKLKI